MPSHSRHAIGSLIIDLEAHQLTAEEREILTHPLVGGIILFSRNYANLPQLSTLCKHIREIKKTPILITVDQEGGRVQRFKGDDFTLLPALGEIGKLYDTSPEKSCSLAQNIGRVMASEILAAGIDLSFAPVLDLNTTISPVIGDRAFHANPAVVTVLANHFIRGMQLAGMAATGKHFPGHGSIPLDSHVSIPRDARELAVMEANDLIPFLSVIKAEIPALMLAHIVCSAIDEVPVSLSGYWIKDILRAKYGFKGALFSDDLNMQAANISSNYADRVLMAREAGCDFALVCNNREGVIQILNEVDHGKHQVTADKWYQLQGNFDKSETHNANNRSHSISIR